MFQIEDNVPLPSGVRQAGKYPFDALEPTQSFFVPLDGADAEKRTNSLRSLASDKGKKLGRKFAVRLDGNGVRIWRTA